MYSNYFNPSIMNQYGYQPSPYAQHPYFDYSRAYSHYPYEEFRQQSIRGQATWTEGGQVTRCGIPWSHNQFMTVAVGENTPYQCGQTIKVTYLATQRDLLVTVVDRVPGYPRNKINLHRKAFEALGANPDLGVINVLIDPSPQLEKEKWGKYLLEVTQAAYPSYNVTNYRAVEKSEVSPGQMKETYEFVLVSPREQIRILGNVVYNPNTDRIISFDIKEI